MSKSRSRNPGLATLVRRYLKLYSGAIYNILEEMGLPNQVLTHEIRPLEPTMKMAGPAYTLKGGRHHSKQKRWPRPALLEGMQKRCVAIYDARGDDHSGHWGELTSNRAAIAGCQGVVVDGGARDSTLQLQIPNWNCFCRYASPIEAATRGGIVSIGEPILMSGSLTSVVEVRPDDFVFADLDGVTIIPQEIVVEVLEKAEDVIERENKGRAMLWKGKSMADIAKKYGVG